MVIIGTHKEMSIISDEWMRRVLDTPDALVFIAHLYFYCELRVHSLIHHNFSVLVTPKDLKFGI